VPLVNVVRRPEQAALLREAGARFVVDTSSADFPATLADAIAETGATIAFDAVSGGRLASQILTAMEQMLAKKAGAYSRYGSSVHKQVYLYGVLDTSPTELHRSYGMAWGVGGWLLTPFMQKAGADVVARLKARVAGGLKTTFASHYGKQVSLAGALALDDMVVYAKRATGAKYLVCPHQGP
jgi:NADPH:quinone reductase